MHLYVVYPLLSSFFVVFLTLGLRNFRRRALASSGTSATVRDHVSKVTTDPSDTMCPGISGPRLACGRGVSDQPMSTA